jgi:hypothetical protein
MRAQKLLLVVVVLLVCGSLSLFAGSARESGGAMKQLNIRIMTDLSGPPTKPPTEDVLTPILREKTGVTAVPFPQPAGLGTTQGAIAQALIAGNNLPEIITESYFPPQPDGLQVLLDNDMVWDFHDMAFLKKMFPNYTSRIEKYGDLNVWYQQTQTKDGTHIRLDAGMPTIAFNKLMTQMAGTRFALDNGPGMTLYKKMLRDDILKMIYPNARSDKEQEQWFINTFDYTNPGDPWSDIPIKSMDDLYNYMKKVKEVIDSKGLKDIVGRDKMIVAQLNAANGNPPSLMWSNISMYGYQWVEPPFVVADKAYYNFQAPWVKGVLQWWNKCYNEGLLDPEVFVKQDTQVTEEITRGRFAIFPDWGYSANARKFAKDNGSTIGYRQLDNTWPMTAKATYSDASHRAVTYYQHFNANLITKTVKEADLPQVAAWLDYHFSEEWDVLRSWGPASFYTGTDENRRFKAEYKDLENFQAYGIAGGKDGVYYGITDYSAAAIEAGVSNWETHIGQLMNDWPYAPKNVYPFKKTAGMDYDAVIAKAVGQYQGAKQIKPYPQIGWSFAELNATEGFADIQYMWFGTHGPAIAKAITDPPANFEANYAAYQKVFTDNNWDQGMANYQAKWTEIYNKYVKQYWQ